MSSINQDPDLNIGHLAEVDGLLAKYNFTTNNYEKLGLHLGLSPNTIDVISAKKGDATRYLLECLKAWLKKCDKVEHPTYPNLIRALRKIGEVATAEGICEEIHPACCIFKQYTQDQSVVQALPQLALYLNKEGIIGEMVVPTNGSNEKLISAIKDSICADKQNLEKFAIVLQNLSSTAEAGILIRKDYRKKFPMNDSAGAEMSSEECDKSLKIPSVDEFVAMRNKFASMVTDACSAMKEIPSNELKDHLRRGYSYLAPQLGHSQTTDLMLDLVCDRCSITNVSLLENVASHFEIKNAMTFIEKYKKSLQEFKPLRAFLEKELFSGSPLQSDTITFIVDQNVDDYTLTDVTLLLQHIFKDLAPHITIKVIKEHHSFIVSCSFPLALSEQLIAKAEENIELLKEKGVTKLTIGYCTVYDTEEVNKIDEGAEVDKTKKRPLQDERSKLEQLMLSQNMKLLNIEQELISLQKEKEETEKIKTDEFEGSQKLNEKALLMDGKQIEKDEKVKESELPETENLKAVVPREKTSTIFEDDVYKKVSIDHPLLEKIIKTRQFKRLKDIKKLGCVYQNMPKATYSRFQQSIGMCYLAGKFVKKLKKRQPELLITESDVLCVQIAALSYNLGFGPFSYLFNDWFLKEIETNWKRNSSASVMMFQYMINDNDLPFEKYLENPEQDTEFIKELITGIKGPQAERRKDKIFLYEIVVNKKSGLDVSRIDYTARDTAVILGKGIHFSWKEFLNKICVKTCPDGEKHICATDEDDLEIYNRLFADRHILFKQLYYDRKNRILAAMVNRILIKCGDAKLIRGPDGKRLTLVEAIESMDTYARLTDGILDVVKEQVDDKEVQDLIHCLERSKLFIPIGYIKQYEKSPHDLAVDIIMFSEIDKEELQADDIIVDRIKSGYEESAGQTMYYTSSNGSVQQWINEWQPIPHGAFPAPWRVFLTKRDKVLVEKVKNGLKKVIKKFTNDGDTYEGIIDTDLTPEEVTVDSAKVSVKLIPEEVAANSAKTSVKSIV